MDIRGFEVVSAFEEQDINLPTVKQQKAQATILNALKLLH